MSNSLVKDTDSYKASHPMQYPPGTTSMFSYFESRGGDYDETVFFGLQYYLKEYLTKRITAEDVEEARAFFTAHGEPFPYDGWMHIVNDLNGKLPIRIRALPEGTVVPNHNVLMTVESTDPKTFWVVTWLETMLVRLWYPITVATRSRHIKKIISEYLLLNSDNILDEIDFKLHDFGSRGVSSRESAMIGGMAHLVNFMGSDTAVGVWGVADYYNEPLAAYSIPAAEHSTITAWGKENELEAYRNMLNQFAKPGSLVAVVSDSYNLWNAISNLWGKELKQQVIDSGATVIIRPDSGDPPAVVLKTLQLLDEAFGHTKNSKGYKVLNNVKVIQGDGVNENSIDDILQLASKNGYAASNIAFGMGGGLLQQLNRDTLKFAFKCSNVIVNGQYREIYKDPITDPGKASKRGRVDLITNGAGEFETVNIRWGQESVSGSELRTVFENGEILIEENFSEIRERALDNRLKTIREERKVSVV